ncbi:hypothetical protein [Luedemannella helvata]|uniref:Uncharacterized protein n=1 Tax=Luedemannella helvata TaxID=349315 RepID=A0ABN2K7F7_9ACTN
MAAHELDSHVIVDTDALAAPSGDAPAHRCRAAPEEHLCSCGRLREDCVRDTVRAVWST